MTKKFLCVQGSPETPKGTIVEQREALGGSNYIIVQSEDTSGYGIAYKFLQPWQVEGNDCWEEVREEIKKEDKPTRWKPKMGQPFYCLDESGFVEEDEWDGTLGDQRKWDIGNCFQTKQDARDEAKRRESIANAWRPKGWDECWIWSFTASKPMKCIYSTDCDYTGDAYIGAVHPTEEACKQWGETYAHLFLPKTE